MDSPAWFGRLGRTYQSLGTIPKFLLLFLAIVGGQAAARLVPDGVAYPLLSRALVVTATVALVLLGVTAVTSLVRPPSDAD